MHDVTPNAWHLVALLYTTFRFRLSGLLSSVCGHPGIYTIIIYTTFLVCGHPGIYTMILYTMFRYRVSGWIVLCVDTLIVFVKRWPLRLAVSRFDPLTNFLPSFIIVHKVSHAMRDRALWLLTQSLEETQVKSHTCKLVVPFVSPLI